MPAVYQWLPIHIEQGDAQASISLNRAVIRFPEPFGLNGLTDACRAWIAAAVDEAIERDGLQRRITWPDQTVDPSWRAAS